jgi:hypothetical protein
VRRASKLPQPQRTPLFSWAQPTLAAAAEVLSCSVIMATFLRIEYDFQLRSTSQKLKVIKIV